MWPREEGWNPSSVRHRPPFSNIFSETAWPIEAKFHVEPPWVGGTKVCSGRLGHMTNMAAMPILFFSGSKGPMTLMLVMQHWGLEPNKVYSNDDLGLTLTYFMARSNFLSYGLCYFYDFGISFSNFRGVWCIFFF